MRTTTSSAVTPASAVLAAARESRRVADEHEVRILVEAVAWARLHVVDGLDDAAQWVVPGAGRVGLALGGVGIPLIAEWCVAEFAAAVGLSTDAGMRLLAAALELEYRLPRLWARVRSGGVSAWRARRVAEATASLSRDAVAFVDAQVANYAHSLGPAALERLVAEGTARFMPGVAAQQAEAAADRRCFTVDLREVSFEGTSLVYGELDLADAVALEQAVSAGAAQLQALGSSESLDVRRSVALGELARRQLAFGFETEATAPTPGPGAGGGGSGAPVGREIVLYAHVSAETILDGGAGVGFARVEHHGNRLLTPAQVAAWCGADATRVTVRPVIDLNAPLASDA